MHYTYLLLDLFTIAVPLACSFDSKLQFYKRWKYYLPSLLITAVIFLIWDYFKTKYGVWSFNDQYIIGIRFFGLPLEEILFFVTIPYACTFIYEALGQYILRRIFPDRTIYILWLLSLIAFAGSLLALHRAYTFSVLIGISIVLPIATLTLTDKKLDRFLQMYLISLLPMFIVNGVLTALPIVIYNNNQNCGIRLGSIPLEDFIYSAILLLMNIGLYEKFKRAIN